MPPKPKTVFEFSAGGIVKDSEGKILMVQVENLEQLRLWTFPKGHIETGETPEQSAIREVQEETGYLCEIVEPLERVQYWFKRGKQLTKKTVTWYLMKPLKQTGKFDPEEILATRWITIPDAAKIVRYRSDKQLLAKMLPPAPPAS